MILEYDFGEYGFEYEVEPTTNDFIDYLCPDMLTPFETKAEAAAWKKGAKDALSHALRFYDAFKEEVEDDDDFKDYLLDVYQSQALEAYEKEKAEEDA